LRHQIKLELPNFPEKETRGLHYMDEILSTRKNLDNPKNSIILIPRVRNY